jgi:hypothetical protein
MMGFSYSAMAYGSFDLGGMSASHAMRAAAIRARDADEDVFAFPHSGNASGELRVTAVGTLRGEEEEQRGGSASVQATSCRLKLSTFL